MRRNKGNPTLTAKIVAFIAVAIIISSATIGIVSYSLHRSQSIKSRGSEALHIAVTMARCIDGDKFEEIMRTQEKTDYWYEIKAYADILAGELGTAYLYIVDVMPDGDVVYFVEGTLYDPYDLGTVEDGDVYAPELFDTMNTGISAMTEAYDSGEYGGMVSGFAAVYNSRGEVVGVVGVDFFFEDILDEVNAFGLSILIIVFAFIVLFYSVATAIGKRFIGKPLASLDAAAKQLAHGDMNIQIDIRSKSEIGRLSQSFMEMVDAMKTQVTALDAISHGDLTVDIKPRSDEDTMGHAIVRILDNLGGMFGEIDRSARLVSTGSSQISDGAQTLARGATEQAATVEQLSAAICSHGYFHDLDRNHLDLLLPLHRH